MDAAEFLKMMEEIDADLRREGVRIDRRQIEGFTRVCQRLHIGLTLTPLRESAIPGKYEGDSLTAHVLGWFEARYGDRLKTDFSVAHVVALIRGDPWRLHIPRVFGTVAFVCDRQLAPYRGRPSFSSNGTIPVFNILNAIEDLPDGLAASLSRQELETLVSFFVSAGQAVVALEDVLQTPLVPEAPRLLSFGGGPHYCLGAALARTTLEESVRGVAEIAPQLNAAPDSLEWSQVLGRSPARLPVTI